MLATSLILSGCDGKKNIVLNGERENFLKLSPKLIASSKIKPHFSGNERVNSSWPDHKGLTLSYMPKLAEKPNELWSISAGESQTREQRTLQAPVVQDKALYILDAAGMLTAYQLDFSKSNDPSKNPSSQLMNSPKQTWRFETLTEEMKAHSIGSGFFTIHNNMIYITTSVGELIALNTKDGSVAWRKAGYPPFRSAPCIFGDKLIALSANNEVNTVKLSNGEKLWTHTGVTEATQLMQAATPIEASNTVIVAYSSGEIYALNGTTGHTLWSDTLTPVARIDTVTGMPHISANPLIDDNHVYVISHGGKAVALNLTTGSRIWEKDVSGSINPTLYGDFIYLISNENELVCLHKKTGDVAWITILDHDKNDGRRVCAGFVLAGNQIIINTNLGEILFFDINTGKRKQAIKNKSAFSLSPAIAYETLILIDEDANLYGYA